MTNFQDSALDNDILKAIEEMGFKTPTPVQLKTIPSILNSDRDLIALAQTGTGKTAAFGLPIIHLTDTSSFDTQAIVLCPTRELCVQICKDLDQFSKYKDGLKTLAVYGGANIEPQIKALKKGVHVVVGTPGRTLDLLRRKLLKINNVSWLVLDEADEMLNMGFKEDLDSIMSETPQEKQTLLFSATMSREIESIARRFMQDPEVITIGKKNSGADNVAHNYYMVHARHRYDALKRIVDVNPNIYGIVFCRTRQETKDIADKLMGDGYNADALHGDLSQAQRDLVMGRFRSGILQLLVATDVAARGLDVNNLSHIINYNLPDELEAYIHRSGRTGRADKTGTSIVIIHSKEKHKIKTLEKLVGKPMAQKPVPMGKEICEVQLLNLVSKIEQVEVRKGLMSDLMPQIHKKFEHMSKEEVVNLFVASEFNRFLDFYKNAPDLNVESETYREKSHSRNSKSDYREKGLSNERSYRNTFQGRDRNEGYSKFFINLGTKAKINPVKLIALIKSQTRRRNIDIGKIEIERNFSFFETDSRYTREVENSFKNLLYENKNVIVDLRESDEKPSNQNKAKNRPHSARQSR
jgi:ATP-dependent RNA helicase DeaD